MLESAPAISDSSEKVNVTPMELARFWAKVDKVSSPHGCWLWTASASHGYGHFRFRRKTTQAPIVAWIIHTGYRSKVFVCHNCPGGDNSLCVNPDHLWEGTQAENNQDCAAKGRHNKPSGDAHYSRITPEKMARGDRNGTHTHPETVRRGDQHHFRLRPEAAPRGERNAGAKLTEVKVREIRKKLEIDCTPKYRRVLSTEYGVCRQIINRIWKRTLWKHVE